MDADSPLLGAKQIKMALRFRKSQARVLENLAEQAKQRDLPGQAVGLFLKAAESTRNGEPLIVICDEVDEAHAMAQGFAVYGVVPPTVESLSGLIVK